LPKFGKLSPVFRCRAGLARRHGELHALARCKFIDADQFHWLCVTFSAAQRTQILIGVNDGATQISVPHHAQVAI
jgi:hypothetical protein